LIPIIIHLVKLRRYRKVYFSNTEMLSELQSEQRSRSRLREWLVLAARVLAIVFLVLAFAQPKVRRSDQSQQIGATCVSVYIDNSFSMGREGTNGILLEQAKKKAREISAAYPSDTKYQIVTNDNAGRHRRVLTREEFVATIDKIQLSPQTSLLDEVMTKQRDFDAIASCSNTHAYVVSDFQRSVCDWDKISNVISLDSTARVTRESTGHQSTRFSFIPLAATGQGNIYIDSIWLDTPLANVGSMIQLSVMVSNTGDKRIESLPLKLYLNGEQKALTNIEIEKQSQAIAKLSFTVHVMGTMNGYVELSDYPVTFDDKMFFSVNVKPKLHVLALHGTAPNTFIRRLFDADSLSNYTESSLASADFSIIDKTDLITVTSAGIIQSGIAQTLAEFVSDGGSLLIAPPADCDIASYNTLFSALNAPHLDTFVETSSACTWLNREAPLYNQVFKHVDNDVELPSVSGYFPLHAMAGTAFEEILSMANGAPYLISVPVGEGVAYIFTAPIDPKYSDFMQQALFVPTIYNMALFSRPPLHLYYTIGADNMIELTAIGSSSSLTFSKYGDDGHTVAETRHNGKHSYLVVDGIELDAGNYLLSNGSEVQGISFNYSRKESLMQFFEPKELASAIKSMPTDNIELFNNDSKPLDELIKQRSGGTSLAKWCLLTVLFFLLCETLLLRVPFRNWRPAMKDNN